MNPELQAKLDNLQKQIDEIREARDLIFSESIKKRVVNAYVKKREEIETADAGLTQTISLSGLAQDITAPANYELDVVFEIDGDLIRIGGYNV